MGPRNFIRRFKAATGRVPGAYLQTLRVSAAKEPFEHGDASIQTVSSKIGYEDIGFFRNLFKRHTSMTPGEYRDKFSQMSLERGELISGSAVRRCTLSQGVRDLAAGKCLTASRAASSIVVNTAPSLRSRSTRSSSASIL
jgi:Helix-turn-helix domain